ncbi:MAG: hemin ABC transporter substrate-binding protein [Thermomicrobiales bacterium]|nr:hemin ABC transporter substrate-binding protein [Thermomicrobiales bacterium]
MNRRTFTQGAAALLAISPIRQLLAQDATPESAVPELPVTVTDVNGNEVTVTDVSRIIPLNGNVTETIFALGLGANVVAVDESALYPEEATELPQIGYQRSLSAEGVLSFEPTLVIGTTEAGPEDVIQQIADAGVALVIFEAPGDPHAASTEIRNIATAVGLPEAGEQLASGVEQRLADAEALAASSASQPRVAFLYIRGAGTQLLSGSGSAADGVIMAAGGINVGAEIGIEGYQPITPEALVTAAPDVILVMQGGLESIGGVDGLLEIPGVAETPAGMDRHIVAFEDLYLLGFGPRIGDSVYDLTIAIHDDIDAEPLHPEWQGWDDTAPEASPAA